MQRGRRDKARRSTSRPRVRMILLSRSPLVWWFVGGSNFSKCDVSRPATAGRPQSTRLAAAHAQFGTDRRRVLWAFTRRDKPRKGGAPGACDAVFGLDALLSRPVQADGVGRRNW
jgi:hypothetical protein